MIRRPPRSTLFPTRRSSDLLCPPASEELQGLAASCSGHQPWRAPGHHRAVTTPPKGADDRSEEHTSELQSRQYLVCRLLLEKKKKKHEHNIQTRHDLSEIYL